MKTYYKFAMTPEVANGPNHIYQAAARLERQEFATKKAAKEALTTEKVLAGIPITLIKLQRVTRSTGGGMLGGISAFGCPHTEISRSQL